MLGMTRAHGPVSGQRCWHLLMSRLCPICNRCPSVWRCPRNSSLCTLSSLKSLYYFSSHDLGSLEVRSKCFQLFKVYRLNLRGVSELPAESVCSALMYYTVNQCFASAFHDVGQIMCYLSRIWHLLVRWHFWTCSKETGKQTIVKD